MSIKLKTLDGKKISLKVTRCTTVEELKCEVEKQLNVKKDLQRLFFSGKQLENGYHLANYNIKFNDTILLMVKTVVNDIENKENTKEEKVDEEKELEKGALETNLEKAESLYYKIGDAVDCMYDKTGAWYEAIIKNIYKKEAQMFYKISWEFDNTLCPDDIPEIHIRPRAQRSILFDELSIGDKLKKTKKKFICSEKERKWGGGMACVGRQKVCGLVSSDYSGEIPGVDVGTTWMFRIQVSEAGVHRPPVAGIHGRESDCAYSIVLSGGYAEDYDNGDEFLYSGSGGRDLSGNKRTNSQSKNQVLQRMNLALAKNCNASLNEKIGASAGNNWRNGKPVRVVRNYKLGKFSKYAPKEGNRYDGLYKVVKYYPDTSNGFLIWKYVLRRDDPTPAPWTKEGKKRIEFLGLKMLYPDGYLKQENNTKKKISAKKRSINGNDEEGSVPIKKSKKSKLVFDLEDKLKNLIENDKVNAKLWDECRATLINGKPAFLDCVSERFKCACCLGILYNPVTTPCKHNICLKCLKRSFASEIYFCPVCRYSLGNTYDMKVNEILSSALLLIYPGYQGER
ncbi:E3 ubiquitin-protein ligase UHRF1 [Trachymyrmex septentrionalis]|uniref:E3 ubiquitin-protein ligase UHRF1 n=1 Tax=Trachymyrmex septentrionalis TaxID=34720 RepID=A0A195FJW8_9HYME|nr:E3 ubiquitin-protein ligase UHRF1 [Trachymyrmex septentrionalis]